MCRASHPDRSAPLGVGLVAARRTDPCWYPRSLAYYHAPGGSRMRFVQESSNGCASGGALAEAVYYGLMEVVERDAFLLAWYGRAALPEIDPADQHPCRRPGAMVDRLAMYGYRARFFDTRITFPVPVVTAVAERVDGGPGRLCFGAGASLDPEAALAAGLCEIATDAVNLRRRTVREEPRLRAHGRGLRPGAGPARPPAAVRTAGDGPVRRLPAARAARPHGFRCACPRAGRSGGRACPPATCATTWSTCVAAVTARGFDVVVVDQTGPEQRDRSASHTAKVLVPGLLPDRLRLEPPARPAPCPGSAPHCATAGLRDG